MGNVKINEIYQCTECKKVYLSEDCPKNLICECQSIEHRINKLHIFLTKTNQ